MIYRTKVTYARSIEWRDTPAAMRCVEARSDYGLLAALTRRMDGYRRYARRAAALSSDPLTRLRIWDHTRAHIMGRR